MIFKGFGSIVSFQNETTVEFKLLRVSFAYTVQLFHPSVEVKSVKKKWKAKQFSAGVDRSIIEKGAEELGVEISDLINDTILGMREVAEIIGLKGVIET